MAELTFVNEKMNTPKANQRDHAPSETPSETLPRKDFTPQKDSSSLTEIPHRASAMTPVLMDMLARVEGVARWGLNE